MLERLGRALWVNGETEAALEAHEAAVADHAGRPADAGLARVLSGYGQILMLLDRWSESLALCERAVAIARDVGARQVEGHALNTLGLDLAVVGAVPDAISPLEEALAIAREVANADDIGRGYVNLCEAQRFCGDLRGATRGRPRGAGRGDEVGMTGRTGRSSARTASRTPSILATGRRRDSGPRRASRPCQPRTAPQRRYGLSRWVPLLVATATSAPARSSTSSAA